MGGSLCSWRTYGAMPCRPNPRGPPPVLRRRYLYLFVRGLLYLLLIWMWRRLKRRWTALGLILILRPFRPRRSGPESPWHLPGVHRLPPPQPQHPSLSPQSSHRDPNLRPGLEKSGRGVPAHLSRPRESVRQVELTPMQRGSRGVSLVWAVAYLSDGIMRRARCWAWVLRGPADLPPRDGILMGFQAGLPAKRLRIPKVSCMFFRGIPCACDPVLRSARGSLQALAPFDQGLRPLRRCDPLYVRSEPLLQFVGFLVG